MTDVKRIAIQHPYKRHFAETESAERVILAAKRMGIEAKECTSPDEVVEFNPDFVLSFSQQDRKLTPYPSYIIMMQPITAYHMTERIYLNTLSYDGYLTLSPKIEQWIEDVNFGARKTPLIGQYANTTPAYDFVPPNLDNPSLAYFGTNWDGARFHDLFVQLSLRKGMRIYGHAEKWQHVHPDAYCGLVPFDGESVLDVYRDAGVGLSLCLEDFNQDGLTNNRLFEITSSGAVTISDKSEFAEKHFGDSLLYVDTTAPIDHVLKTIDSHMAWISENPEAATEMAQEAHRIFNETLSLDVLLPNLLDLHKKVVDEKYTVRTRLTRDETPDITCIVRTGNRPDWMLDRAVKSISKQTNQNVRVLYVPYAEQDGLDLMADRYKNLEHVISPCIGGNRSDTLWHGLEQAQTPYVAILDDDDEIIPNHYQSLLDTFAKNDGLYNFGPIGTCYSGLIRASSERTQKEPIDHLDPPRFTQYSSLHFQPFNIFDFASLDFGLSTCGSLIRRDAIDADVLRNPRLNVAEDVYLFHLLATKAHVVFSWEMTAICHDHEHDQSDHLNNYDEIVRILHRLHDRLMLNRYKHTTWDYYHLHNTELSKEKKKEISHKRRLFKLLQAKGFLDKKDLR